MAISLIAKPQSTTPAYNQMRFIYDSTNKNKDGFKYIFEVFDGATLLETYKVLPDFPNGYGNIDPSKLIQSYLKSENDIFTNNLFDPTNSYKEFTLKVGEEYIESYNYILNLTDSGGNVRINFTSPFVVGDQIFIDQSDGGSANPNLQGFFTVLSSASGYIVVNSAWADITNANIDGTVRYANNQKTVTLNVTNTTHTVTNSAFTFAQFQSFNFANYRNNSASSLFYTNVPLTNFSVTPTQDFFLFINNPNPCFMHIENSFNEEGDIDIDIAPFNYLNVGYSSVGLSAGAEWYSFQLFDALDGAISQKYIFTLDNRCKIEEYEILFLDRLGSMGSFAFQLRAYEKGNVTRENYNRPILGKVVSEKWRYDTQDFGMTNLNTKVEKILELNTNWMSEQMAQYFEELITSPVTYIKIDGDYYACLVQDNSFEVFKQKNKNLIKQKITVKLANNNAING
jgi:hypothetical protein